MLKLQIWLFRVRSGQVETAETESDISSKNLYMKWLFYDNLKKRGKYV